MSADTFQIWCARQQAHIENCLQQWLPAEADLPGRLHAAMRYTSLGGGKRMRPLLVYAAGALSEAPARALDHIAAALEMVHVYSLVHDDLPAMDDDDFRRGKPTVHKQYDEATALLVGDALQAQAFATLADCPLPAAQVVHLTRLLAEAAGSRGMCGGQSIDLESVGLALDLPMLETMHRMKTGALLRAAVQMGAHAGLPHEASGHAALATYADAVGLAFQVVDDVLDATADSATLGKTAGKDAAQNKPTYVSLLGLEASRTLASTLCARAHAALERFGSRAQRLHELADLVVLRQA